MAVITKQELEDAALDAQTLEDVANGDENTTVTSRLGQGINSVAKAIAEISSYNDTGAWLTSTAYAIKDLVQEAGVTYICITAHTSGTFATDQTAGYWGIFQTEIPDAPTTSYRLSFTDADLTTGKLVVTHNLDEETLIPALWDDNDELVVPDGWQIGDLSQADPADKITLDLTSFGTLVGTYRLVLMSGSGASGTGSDGTIAIRTATGTTDTPTAADVGKTVRMTNASANTVTINTSVFSAEDVVVVRMAGAGTTTIQGGAGMTVNGSVAGSVAIAGQYKDAMLHFISSTEVEIIGAI